MWCFLTLSVVPGPPVAGVFAVGAAVRRFSFFALAGFGQLRSHAHGSFEGDASRTRDPDVVSAGYFLPQRGLQEREAKQHKLRLAAKIDQKG